MGNARMRANSIALALCITEAEFSAWTERLVAARSMDAYALVYPAPSPSPLGYPNVRRGGLPPNARSIDV